MRRPLLEILLGILFVTVGTTVAFPLLSGIDGFWTAQNLWNAGLIACWAVVAGGYWHQGNVIYKSRDSRNVSLMLPCAVFIVQCILFVKGVAYRDAALMAGALLVNSAVVFDIYQITRFRRH